MGWRGKPSGGGDLQAPGCRTEPGMGWEAAAGRVQGGGSGKLGAGRRDLGGVGEGGRGGRIGRESDGFPVPASRMLTCCASRVGSTPFASSLSTSAPPPPTPTPPALQDPAPNPTCLSWGFWSSSLVCRDLPRPCPRPSGVRLSWQCRGTQGSGGGTMGRRAGEGQGGAEGPAAPGRGRQQVWAAAVGVGGSRMVGWGVALKARV